jgi:hypothetical protein
MPTEQQKNTNEKGANVQAGAMQASGMQIAPRGRFWAVHDRHGQLVCVTVYKKGAREVVRRLSLISRNRPARKASAPARWTAPSTRKRLPRSRHVAARASDEKG